MKLKSSKRKLNLFLSVFSIAFIGIVIFVSCQKQIKTLNAKSIIVAFTPLNLSDEKQQSDFQNYLKKTVDFLHDSSHSYLFSGHDLSNLSSNDKTQIANNMLKDQNFMNKLKVYQEMLGYIENTYQASSFTKEQWNEVIKFGMDRGIYFLPGLKEKVKKMEEKSLAMMKSNGNGKVDLLAPGGTTCQDKVAAANTELGYEVGTISLTCAHMSEFPIAAAICWAGLAAFYWEENNRINSTSYWCDCMLATYGICIY